MFTYLRSMLVALVVFSQGAVFAFQTQSDRPTSTPPGGDVLLTALPRLTQPPQAPDAVSAVETATPDLEATVQARADATLTALASSAGPTATPDLDATVEARVRATLTAISGPSGSSEILTREAQTQTSGNALVGKWEQVSPSGDGMVMEFFDDGTVNLGSYAGKYSWPDKSHLKIEIAQVSLVFQFSMRGDEFTLTDSTTQTVFVYMRYRELPVNPQSLAGTWKSSYPDESECFSTFGDSSPSEIIFGSLDEFASQVYSWFTKASISGQYSIDGNRIRIIASGTKGNEPVRGQVNCVATVSQSRLLFTDEQGNKTLYVRADQAIALATSTPRIPAPEEHPTSAATVAPSAGAIERRSNDMAEMVFVPAGEFAMGSESGDDNEKPVHPVYLDDYWIDVYEVTNALYKKCMDAGKCQPPVNSSSQGRRSYFGNSQYDYYPVIYVSWENANTYCAWAGKRLPTEAEWEKAARGTDALTYPWGSEWDANKANVEGRVYDTTQVGSYPAGASPYGALDMAGNVLEWVADWYDSNYYVSSPRENPQGPSSGQYRVLRGRGWGDGWFSNRAALRNANDPLYRANFIGFRCAQ